ncbi:MAG TPA: RNA polymerase sigma factor [Gemmatimonadaceae bacterium]|jgi:RNA polymerase sigma-70 factor (ECF subfamily)|nr:RNA polymerase sigma factor [Gemmatimonadaceae bacterium]
MGRGRPLVAIPADDPLEGTTASPIPAAECDAVLVERVLDGDTRAFEELVRRHEHVCIRFATRMLGTLEDAEDATQEALVRAYRALGRYDKRGAFRTWLFAILINCCRTALLRRARRTRWIVADSVAVAGAVAAQPSDGSEYRDAIQRALMSLDPPQREAFLMKHVEQLSYEEMAAITGAGISALKMRVRRACERMQLLLEEDFDVRA